MALHVERFLDQYPLKSLDFGCFCMLANCSDAVGYSYKRNIAGRFISIDELSADFLTSLISN